MVTIFEIPPLYCPLPPSQPHPDAALLEEAGMAWLESVIGFCSPSHRQTLADTRTHELMSRMTPDAEYERVQLAVDWGYLAFALDDLRTDTGRNTLGTGEMMNWFTAYEYAATTRCATSQDRFHYAIADLSRRIQAKTTAAQWRKWVDDQRLLTFGALWESAQRTTGTPTSINTYLWVRGPLAGAQSALSSAEVVAGLHVPADERAHPVVRAALEASCLLIGLDDDIYSYPKEVWQAQQEGRTMADEPVAIPLLMREYDDSLESALTRLVELRNRIMLRLVILHERVLEGQFTHDTRTLVDIALKSVRSTLDWAVTVPRYRNPDGTLPDYISLIWAEFTEQPPRSAAPPLYPAISWWWEI